MNDRIDHLTTNPIAAPKRILIVLNGAIGDVVRALPLLGRIRRGFPTAHIAWAVEPKSAPILEAHPWLDEIILYDRRNAPWSFFPFLRRIYDGHFELAIDLQRHLKSGLVALVSRAPDRIGFSAENTKEGNHWFSTRRIAPQPEMRLKLLQYQAFGDLLGLPATPIEFGLEASDAERERARDLLKDAPRPLLGVILGSSWPSRIYFPKSIAAVIRGVADRTVVNGHGPALFPVLLGGPEEIGLASEVMRELGGLGALNLAGKTSIRDLIAIFPECEVAFGPDSGPMHIAAAVGCPVVSLWGATSPLRSAPWGFDKLAIVGEIPCHPCYLRRCPVGRECMHRIAPETVIDAIARARSISKRTHHNNEIVVPDGAGVSR
ncbi:MAG TPA: glycosyltransferase family 9 protein [Candidatus Binataceae bacterium]|nr:glycosyltransferase family 9 protein [Candidatus Binataceae bacterium]